MYYYFYDWNDNYQSFDTLKEAEQEAILIGINTVRDTDGGQYFL